MGRTVQLISSLFLAGIISSCQAKPYGGTGRKSAQAIQQKVFYVSYDNVWRAAQLALKYPIAVNNMDLGVLETDFIKADEGFILPGNEKLPMAGFRYKITLNIAKGRAEGRDSVRVTINKQIEKKKNFFSDPELLTSDGLEEKVLFYRIDRELIIDEGLKKGAKSNP
jgi:hypothetical protein